MTELTTHTYRPRHIWVINGDTYDMELDLGFSVYIKVRLCLRDADTPKVYGVKKESAEYAAGNRAYMRVEELFREANEFQGRGNGIVVCTYKCVKGKDDRYPADVFLYGWEKNVRASERGVEQRSLADILIEEGHAEPWKK